MREIFLKVFAVLLVVGILTFSTRCGSDQHTSVVPPIQQQQTKIAFFSGRATGDVTGEPYIMNRDRSSVTPLPYSSMPSMPLGATVAPGGDRGRYADTFRNR